MLNVGKQELVWIIEYKFLWNEQLSKFMAG